MKRNTFLFAILISVLLSTIVIISAIGCSATDEKAYIRGDADGDGTVTVMDATVIQRKTVDTPTPAFNEKAADVDSNGLDITDATKVQRYLAGFDDPYGIGNSIAEVAESPSILSETSESEAPADTAVTEYIDNKGDKAYIPAEFTVSEKTDEQTINTGLVVIGPDGSEFVWIPTTVTELATREFGSYFSGRGSISGYYDEIELIGYQDMVRSVEKYGGFYIGRYEASKGENNLPVSKRVTASEPGQIWVQFSPQDTVGACEALYADNDTVQGFFPWGINWDTTLQWLIDSGCKTESEVTSDSTGWGNYSNDSFSQGARGNYTGAWEEAKANNIYDLAGNNWEWTQERYGTNYVMRGGGYNLMGGSCPGDRYPAALRDPLPGNNHHPNVTFRVALYLK